MPQLTLLDTTPQPHRLNFQPEIEGLRAIAIIAVVVFHGYASALPGGYAGVDLFFVLSGYLIGRILWTVERPTVARFLAARLLRLAPALVLVLGVSWGLGYALLGPTDCAALGKSLIASAFWGNNLLLASQTGYFDSAAVGKPLLHLWSLGVEAQFYLLAPALVLGVVAFRRGTKNRVIKALAYFGVIAFVLIAPLWALTQLGGVTVWADFYLLPWRLWQPLLGMALAWWSFKPQSTPDKQSLTQNTVSALLLLAATAIALSFTGLVQTGFERLWPVHGALSHWATSAAVSLSCVLILWLASAHATTRRLLSMPWMVALGRISYPWYLWHWPLLVYAGFMPLNPVSGGLSRGSQSIPLLMILISLALAWLTHRWIELPLRRYQVRLNAQLRFVVLYAACLLAMAGLGWFTLASHGFDYRFTVDQRQLAQLQRVSTPAMRERGCFLLSDQTASAFDVPLKDACVDVGDGSSHQPLVMLWGDSHAAHLLPGLRAGLPANTRLAQFTSSGCPPLLGYFSSIHPDCVAINAHVLAQVQRFKPALLIMMSRWEQHPQAVNQNMLALTLAQVSPHAARVLVVGPTPVWQPSLPAVLLKRSNPSPNNAQSNAQNSLQNRIRIGLDTKPQETDAQLMALFKSKSGVTYFSPVQALCNEQGCMTYVQRDAHQLTTHDYGHLTPPAATWLVESMIKKGAISIPKTQ